MNVFFFFLGIDLFVNFLNLIGIVPTWYSNLLSELFSLICYPNVCLSVLRLKILTSTELTRQVFIIDI